ncbi:hypothetical protein B0H11DRAFT_1918498 [Mycena galericulata]|nr:hypothetical protein B0H11DRAFT_1918498 [Mycena galericulata]
MDLPDPLATNQIEEVRLLPSRKKEKWLGISYGCLWEDLNPLTPGSYVKGPCKKTEFKPTNAFGWIRTSLPLGHLCWLTGHAKIVISPTKRLREDLNLRDPNWHVFQSFQLPWFAHEHICSNLPNIGKNLLESAGICQQQKLIFSSLFSCPTQRNDAELSLRIFAVMEGCRNRCARTDQLERGISRSLKCLLLPTSTIPVSPRPPALFSHSPSFLSDATPHTTSFDASFTAYRATDSFFYTEDTLPGCLTRRMILTRQDDANDIYDQLRLLTVWCHPEFERDSSKPTRHTARIGVDVRLSLSKMFIVKDPIDFATSNLVGSGGRLDMLALSASITFTRPQDLFSRISPATRRLLHQRSVENERVGRGRGARLSIMNRVVVN